VVVSVFLSKLRRYVHMKNLTTNGSGKCFRQPPLLCDSDDLKTAYTQSSSSENYTKQSWDGSEVTVRNFLHYVKEACDFYKDQLVEYVDVPANSGDHAPELLAEKCIPPSIQTALSRLGIVKLYSHQARGIKPLLNRDIQRHVVCTTSTSSGKSMIYTIPIVSELIADPNSTTLLLFPTKALAHDQLASLRRFCTFAGLENASNLVNAFDGDTKRADRPLIRDTSKIIITNPDMLHCTIMPMHEEWSDVLKNVKFIVIDEAHVYTGVFGNHVSLVIRRLLRLCHLRKANPRVICCSATIANPVQHMVHLTGVAAGEIVTVDMDGSPKGARIYGFWNPSYLAATAVDDLDIVAAATNSPHGSNSAIPWNRSSMTVGCEEQTCLNLHQRMRKKKQKKKKKKRESTRCSTEIRGKKMRTNNDSALNVKSQEHGSIVTYGRRSPYTEAACLLSELIKHNLRSIVFVKARHVAELVLKRTKNRLPGHLQSKVASYRSGYLASERRRLEAAMVDGSLVGMVATNALELGIDIGILDATLHVGFPGTKSSFLQQAGRAGRGSRDALSILIAMDCPIDQFLINNAKRLLSTDLKSAVADPTNTQQLSHHLVAAAWEHPLNIIGKDQLYFGSKLNEIVLHLSSRGQLKRLKDSTKYLCEAEVSPARLMGIRDVSEDSVSVIDAATGRTVEIMDSDAAPFKLYDGAVYMHQGSTYVVKQLDLDSGVCRASKQNVDYYTEPRHHTRVAILGVERCCRLNMLSSSMEQRPPKDSVLVHSGGVNISHHFYGYNKRGNGDSKILEKVDMCHLPAVEYTTRAVWIQLPNVVRRKLRKLVGIDPDQYAGTLHAIEHVIASLCPLVISCDSLDLAGQCTRRDSDPCIHLILLYERQRGGIGIISQIMDKMKELLEIAQERIIACTCKRGCPTCIHHPRCLDHNEGLQKEAAIAVLKLILKYCYEKK